MLLDSTLLFSENQAVTATAVSTNNLDLRDRVGGGETVTIFAHVTETFATNTSLQIEIRDSADDSSYAAVLSTAAIPVASLVAGYRFNLNALPDRLRRYIQLRYVIGGSNATAGKITAGLVFDKQTA